MTLAEREGVEAEAAAQDKTAQDRGPTEAAHQPPPSPHPLPGPRSLARSFFFFLAAPVEVLGPGVEPVPQPQPEPGPIPNLLGPKGASLLDLFSVLFCFLGSTHAILTRAAGEKRGGGREGEPLPQLPW